jgi:hypothetical protein
MVKVVFRIAADDVLSIGISIKMPNMFSHRVCMKGWSILYNKYRKNMGRKGNMPFFIRML